MRICEYGLRYLCLLLFGLLAISQAGEKITEKLPPEVAKAKKALRSGKPAEKLAAVEVLVKAKTAKATLLLVKVLDYGGGKLRKAAVNALKTRAKSDSSVVPLLVDHLGKSQRESAIEILSALKSPKSLEPLIKVLKEKRFDSTKRKMDDQATRNRLAREAAAQLLGELGDERAIPHLVPMLGSGLLNDAEAGAKALLKFGKKGQAAIISALRNKNPKIGGGAALAVRYFELKGGEKALLDALKDKSVNIQVRGKIALVMAFGLASPETVEAMIAALAEKPEKDPKKDKEACEFKAALGRALGMATQQKFGTDAKKWQKWWEENKAAHTKEYLRRKKLMEE